MCRKRNGLSSESINQSFLLRLKSDAFQGVRVSGGGSREATEKKGKGK